MKILFVSDYFPPFTPGGAEWSIYYLAKALAKRGYEITVLTPNYSRNFLKDEKLGFKIIRFTFPIKLKPGTNNLRYFYNTNFIYYFYSCFWIIKTSLQEKIDLIHLQSRFSLPAAVLAKYLLKIPLVFNLRDSILFCPTGLCLHRKKFSSEYMDFSHFWKKCAPEHIKQYMVSKSKIAYFYQRCSLFLLWIDNFFKRHLLNLCDQVLSISHGLLDLYLKSGLLKKEKTNVVYNLLPDKIEKQNKNKVEILKKAYGLENKKVVLFVSRLTPGKGVYDLAKAAKILKQKQKNTVFLLLGKDRFNLAKHKEIKIIPSVSHKKIFSFYQLADLIVVPSRCVEGLGRIPQEASLFKKPVIVTDTGGLPEQIIHGKTGLIVPKSESIKLAKAILKLLENEKLRRKLGESHYQFIQNKFDEEKIIGKLVSIYKSLIKTK